MLTILRYDFDCGNLGDSIWSSSTTREFLTHLSISWRSEGLATLLVKIIMHLSSSLMKSAMMFDFMLFKALLILITWVLASFIYFLVLLVFIGIMTCLREGPLVVMLMHGLGLWLPLMSLWTCLIFLFWRFRKTSLILRVFFAIFNMFCLDKTCVYDFFGTRGGFFLKNLNNLFTFFRNLARMGGGRWKT